MGYPTFNVGEVLTANDMNAVGLWKIGVFTVNSATTTCDNVFTDDYDNYRIVGRVTGVSNTNVGFLQVINQTGSTLNTGYYGKLLGSDMAGAGTTLIQSNSTAHFPLLWIGNGAAIGCSFSCDISHTRSSTVATSIHGTHAGLSSGAQWTGGILNGVRQNAELNRGFVFSSTAGTTVTGTIRVYGYRN